MMFTNLKSRARVLKTELVALYYAARDPRTPWYARLVMVATLAYAASPIDLIPDFIPVLGYLDDLILVPAGIALSIRLVPAEVMREARERAAATPVSRHANWLVGTVVLVIWLIALLSVGRLGWAWWQARQQP
ncbi:YkvA family protein [Hymenobacter lapidiphilus]|nr:YkvA family protein [Hymenobacter lapidiphilus]